MIPTDPEIALRKDRSPDARRTRIIGKLAIQAMQTDGVGPRQGVENADWYIKRRNRIEQRYKRIMATV